MLFRFSLKWALAAMVYVALATLAFSHATPMYGDGMWLVSIAAIGYAALLWIYARGEQQARAAGFVVLAGMLSGGPEFCAA